MHSSRFGFALALCTLLAACGTTPGSEATAQGQRNCLDATARYLKVSSDLLRQEGSGVAGTNTYEVIFTNVSSGFRSKCTVDQNGVVLGVIELRK